MADEKRSVDHRDLVRVMAIWLERSQYWVATSLAHLEYRRPPPLNGYSPDVYATQTGSRTVIGVAELCDYLHEEATEERWKALFAAVNRPNLHPGYELHIIVPSSCLDEAQQQAQAWNVEATFHTEKLADKFSLDNDE